MRGRADRSRTTNEMIYLEVLYIHEGQGRQKQDDQPDASHEHSGVSQTQPRQFEREDDAHQTVQGYYSQRQHRQLWSKL